MEEANPSSQSTGAYNPNRGWELFLLSFLALFLELMVIRWAPSVVRMVAYYANLMLISSFLGLGIGAMLSSTRRSLFPLIPVLLALSVGFLIIAKHVTMPGSISENRFYANVPKLVNYLCLIGVFLTNAIVFVPIGQRIGRLFESLPPLRAYSWDLGGSLAGTLCFGIFSLNYFSPVLGIGLVSVALVLLLPWRQWLLAVPLLALVVYWVAISNDPNAIWSPYYYITVREKDPSFKYSNERSPAISQPKPNIRTMQNPPAYCISVNHDFYQPHCTMDPERFTGNARAQILGERIAYDLPYKLSSSHQDVLVLGAGGGTDTEVAVLNGAEHVDAVEIDPILVKLSGKFNPADIYDNPKVSITVDDARAFLKRCNKRYDMVVFGWLDSQALFSSMSNLRLDGYIYTRESMRMAYDLLNPDGMLSLSFMAGSDWMCEKLIRMVAESTGKMPIVYLSDMQVIICAPRGKHPEPPASYGRFTRIPVPDNMDTFTVDAPTDDWPYLYLSGKKIPMDYLIVIGLLLAICLPAVYMIRGRKFKADDMHFLFLGLGFLLLETKSIGDCSLYFGTTWFVTMLVVAGVLLMVLMANLVAMRMKDFKRWLYLPLFASLILLYCIDRNLILSLSFTGRMIWTLLVVPLPIFFAGLIFSTTFRKAAYPAAFFGANLIGAMIGGFCEYLGMVTGTRSLMLLVIGAYLLSFLCLMKKKMQ